MTPQSKVGQTPFGSAYEQFSDDEINAQDTTQWRLKTFRYSSNQPWLLIELAIVLGLFSLGSTRPEASVSTQVSRHTP